MKRVETERSHHNSKDQGERNHISDEIGRGVGAANARSLPVRGIRPQDCVPHARVDAYRCGLTGRPRVEAAGGYLSPDSRRTRGVSAMRSGVAVENFGAAHDPVGRDHVAAFHVHDRQIVEGGHDVA